MPRKKGGKKKSLTRTSDVSQPEAVSEEQLKIKSWLDEVCCNIDNFDVTEIPEIDETEIDLDENECNLKELEKPLSILLRKQPDSKIRKLIKIECEWEKCQFETINEKTYFNHVYNHLKEEQTEIIKCKWNLCRFETLDQDEFIRHLDFHAYHTKLKTFGYAITNIISALPVCQNDSKIRNTIPIIPQKYFCHWNNCNESYLTFMDFVKHVNRHISEYQNVVTSPWKHSDRIRMKDLRVKCKWNDCGNRELPNVFELKRHLRTHTNEKLIGCSNCGHLFANKNLFVNHCVRQVVGQRTFKCAECKKLYPTEKLLNDHIRVHVNKYQCSICGLSVQKKSVLARHIRYRHVTDKSFACDECDYKGTTKRDLDSHSNRHKKGDFYKCDVFQCNYSCRTMMALKRHDAREHLGQPAYYICHIHGCYKKFLRGYLLTKHLKSDHDFILAPGHSRFIYKQDEDGFYRLQTKRVENLKEAKLISSKVDVKIGYEIESITKNSNNVLIKIKEVDDEKMEIDEERIARKKDINDFAIVKSYRQKLKK
ncbi:hypothetical protein PVAND_017121 [Polypedilum vanderplanki]|uniref:C2H2-type domain-containing protein n=1 Tax=Polypedilum vanderplanki TaxID=319348 RepID=A0A9J6BHE3_POLVA|nr:hypothetical protein PVAND_017121 [Polypedilum vanderplanki]